MCSALKVMHTVIIFHDTLWKVFELQRKLKERYTYSTLDILFNQVCLHNELKVELKTMQYNYKLSLRVAFTSHFVVALKIKS